jgi:hypothetical protein
MEIYYYMQYFQFACIAFSFLFSLKTVRNDNITGYMKGFYWYTLIAVFLSGITIFNLQKDVEFRKIGLMINKSSFLFHYSFLSIFIYRALNHDGLKKKVLCLFFIFLSIILYLLITTIFHFGSFLINSVTNFILVVFCLFYYYDLFRESPVLNLFKEPSFWIVSGLFLCLTATVPLYVIRGLVNTDDVLELNLIIGAITSFFYGIMYIFFIKAYICSLNLKKI